MEGLIILDLPPEESLELEKSAKKHGFDLTFLLAPNRSEERIREVTEKSRGFFYLVSLTGTTGARQSLPLNLESFVQRVRRLTVKPLCVGFGIFTPEQAQEVTKLADGVISGSRIIQLMEDDITKISGFIKRIKAAMK